MTTEAIPRQNRLYILVEIQVPCAGNLRLPAVATCCPPEQSPSHKRQHRHGTWTRPALTDPPGKQRLPPHPLQSHAFLFPPLAAIRNEPIYNFGRHPQPERPGAGAPTSAHERPISCRHSSRIRISSSRQDCPERNASLPFGVPRKFCSTPSSAMTNRYSPRQPGLRQSSYQAPCLGNWGLGRSSGTALPRDDGGNLVVQAGAAERVAGGIDTSLGSRIDERRGGKLHAEISPQHIRSGNHLLERCLFGETKTFIGGEEKGLVAAITPRSGPSGT